MTLTKEASELKKALKHQLKRLKTRPQENGPFVVYRGGFLLVCGKKDLIVTPKMIAELECLRVGVSPEVIWKVIEVNQK